MTFPARLPDGTPGGGYWPDHPEEPGPPQGEGGEGGGAPHPGGIAPGAPGEPHPGGVAPGAPCDPQPGGAHPAPGSEEPGNCPGCGGTPPGCEGSKGWLPMLGCLQVGISAAAVRGARGSAQGRDAFPGGC
jgi:hypothetical protein